MKTRVILFLLCGAMLLCACQSDLPDQHLEQSDLLSETNFTSSTEVSQTSQESSSPMYEEASVVSEEETTDEAQTVYLQTKIEIYEENTQELIAAFALSDQKICKEIFETFDKCFADLCEKYPHDAAPDKDVKTDYRAVIYLNTYYDADQEDLAYYIDISYPYGYTNDIYRLMHHGGSPFGDYVARCGKPFIDLVDQYVKQYIPAK